MAMEKSDEEAKKPNQEGDVTGGDDGAATSAKRKRKRKRKSKAIETPTDESRSKPPSLLKDTTVENTVYVEGIPFESNADAVQQFFLDKGSIPEADILELRLPTWQDTGRLRGYGHVTFATLTSKEAALALSGEYFTNSKRYLTIQPAKAPKSAGNSKAYPDVDPFAPPPKDCKTIFVHNLPYQATEDEIAQVFSHYGSIVPDATSGVRIARHSGLNRQSKGFCYIDYDTPEQAQAAVCASQNIHVGGRLVRVDYDTGRMKGSFKTSSGRLWTKEQKESGKHHGGNKRSRN